MTEPNRSNLPGPPSRAIGPALEPLEAPLTTWADNAQGGFGPVTQEDPAFFVLMAAEVVDVPKYGASRWEAAARQRSIAAQRGVLAWLSTRLAHDQRVAIELRVRGGRPPRVYVVLRVAASSPDRAGHELGAAQSQLNFLLPQDYDYRWLPEHERLEQLGLDDEYVFVELARPIEFLRVGDVSRNVDSMLAPAAALDTTRPAFGTLDTLQRYFVSEDLGRTRLNWPPVLNALLKQPDAWVRIAFEPRSLARYELAFNGKRSMAFHALPHLSEDASAVLLRRYLDESARDGDRFNVSLQVAARVEATATAVAAHVAAGMQGLRRALRWCPVTDEPWRPSVRSDWNTGRVLHETMVIPDSPAQQSPEVRWLVPGLKHETSLAPAVVYYAMAMARTYSLSETAALARLPAGDHEGLPGLNTRTISPFPWPSRRQIAAGSESGGIANDKRIVRVGRALVGRRDAGEWNIPIDSLARHGFITGQTGSGKSVTTRRILRQLRANAPEVGILVIEPVKPEYAQAFKSQGERGFCVLQARDTREFNFLRFNPLEVPSHITVAEHILRIRSCIAAAWPMGGPLALLLDLALYMVYGCLDVPQRFFMTGAALAEEPPRDRNAIKALAGETDAGKAVHIRALCATGTPDLGDLHVCVNSTEFANAFIPTGGQVSADLRHAIRRRFDSLLRGPLGATLLPEHWGEYATQYHGAFLRSIREGVTVLELDALVSDESKALIMGFVLSSLYEGRINAARQSGEDQGRGHERLRHLTVIEEAHKLLSAGAHRAADASEGFANDARTNAISMFTDMLAEMRSYGEGFLIVEQIPTKIVSDVVRNTHLKLVHELPSDEDRQAMASAMGLDRTQAREILHISRGEALGTGGEWATPALIKVPKDDA